MHATIPASLESPSAARVPHSVVLAHLEQIQSSELVTSLTGSTATATLDRDELVLQNLGSVRSVARRIYERLPQHVDFEELVSAGLVGLMDAATKFDGTKQVQFASYAQIRIRGAILDSLRMLDWSPRELRRQGRAMAEAIRSLSAALGRTPTDEEIAAAMTMSLSDFQQMTGELTSLKVESLNDERTEDSGEEEISFVQAPEQENPLLLCIQGQTREQLAAAIQSLPEKERLVLTLYYFEEMTMREIGATLGVGESRVSQIRTSALRRLKRDLTRGPVSQNRSQPVSRRRSDRSA